MSSLARSRPLDTAYVHIVCVKGTGLARRRATEAFVDWSGQGWTPVPSGCCQAAPCYDARMIRLSGLDERPPALPDGYQSLIGQHADSTACRVPGYPELLHEVGDAGHPAARGKLARADAVPQDRGHLKIRRIGRIMIDSHTTRLNMPDPPR